VLKYSSYYHYILIHNLQVLALGLEEETITSSGRQVLVSVSVRAIVALPN
jgi:hypothetical protein